MRGFWWGPLLKSFAWKCRKKLMSVIQISKSGVCVFVNVRQTPVLPKMLWFNLPKTHDSRLNRCKGKKIYMQRMSQPCFKDWNAISSAFGGFETAKIRCHPGTSRISPSTKDECKKCHCSWPGLHNGRLFCNHLGASDLFTWVTWRRNSL